MRKILITNDDGIRADGLRRLVEEAKEFGEAWVVAPKEQRSAESHRINLHEPIDVMPHDFGVAGVKAFSCSGTPADCVRVGVLHVMPEKPDVVLSGINRGYNTASDIQYSATAGAAFEGSFQGCLSIALSEGYGDLHETTDCYLHDVLGELIELPLEHGYIWNVNFPECTISECKGILRNRTVSSGMVYRDHYKVMENLGGGGVRLMVEGEHDGNAEPGTDLRAVLDGYVSIGTVSNVGIRTGK